MMKEVIRVDFDGYWLESYKSEVPHEAGIYCVYACEPMAKGRIVVLRELIYIGESEDVCASIASEVPEWNVHLQNGEMLCYSFAAADEDVRGRAVRAMIYHHRPPCNRIDGGLWLEDMKLEIMGEHELLDDMIVVGDMDND